MHIATMLLPGAFTSWTPPEDLTTAERSGLNPCGTSVRAVARSRFSIPSIWLLSSAL